METFTRIAKIKATEYKIVNKYLFVLENNNSSPIFVYDIDKNELIKTVGQNHGSGMFSLDDYIVDERYRGIAVRTLMEVDLFKNKPYYYAEYNNKYIIARKFVGEFVIQYILINKESLTVIKTLNIEGSILIFNSNGMIVSRTKDELYIYKYDNDLTFIWKCNISTFYPDQEEVKMYEVKEYQNSLIVLTSAGVLRISAKEGSVIWKTFRYANTIEIVGNIGYICSGLALYKVNLDTGEESGYGWEYERLPDFIYNEKIFWPMGHRVIYHEGLLWYSVYSSGHSFLLAINPDNGNYEWIHHVDTYEKTEAPQFYENKMFLWDTGNTLHIYEKE